MPQVPRGSVSKRADKDSQRSNWLTTVVTYHQTCYRELTNNLEAKANTLTQGLEPETKTSLNCLEYTRNLRPCSIWDLGLPARPWSTQDLGVPKPWSSRDYGLSQTLVSRSHNWKQLDKKFNDENFTFRVQPSTVPVWVSSPRFPGRDECWLRRVETAQCRALPAAASDASASSDPVHSHHTSQTGQKTYAQTARSNSSHVATPGGLYRVGQKRKLLNLSEYANKTDKTWGTWTNTNSYRVNGALSDILMCTSQLFYV